jgi:hypothetical protein
MHRKKFLELWNSNDLVIMAEIKQLRTKMTTGQLCLYYSYLCIFIILIIGIYGAAFYGLYLLTFGR